MCAHAVTLNFADKQPTKTYSPFTSFRNEGLKYVLESQGEARGFAFHAVGIPGT